MNDQSAAKFRAMLDVFGLTQQRVARWFNVTPRAVRRWQQGSRRLPIGIIVLVRLLTAGTVSLAEVELAAASISARTNGRAKREPPAPLRAEPAPEEQPALAPRRARTAARADLDLTTAEKVCALVPETCHWPLNDPRDRDFHFCGAPVVVAPYCPRHALQAHLAPRPGRGVGCVTDGRHGRPSIPGAFSATGASQAPKILLDRAGDLPGGAPPPA